MRRGILIGLSFLCGACAGNPHQAPSNGFSVYGNWESPAGFKLSIRRNGTYEFCDGQRCQSGEYTKQDDTYVVLKSFFRLTASQRFIELADAQPPCGRGVCHRLPSGVAVSADDLEFFDSVADKDAQRTCGTRECTVVGNVETEGGLLFRATD